LQQVIYEYRLEFAGGRVVDGAWESADRPGSIWRPVAGDGAKPTPGNALVKNSCIDEIIREGTVTIDVGDAHADKPWRKWVCP
jgi:hypothetical protein